MRHRSRSATKAITQDTYGAAAVLELRDIDRPEIAVDEVLVHVHAAGVGRGVWHLMTGLPLSPGCARTETAWTTNPWSRSRAT